MRQNTSLSSVGRAPDCSCVKTNVSADIRVSPVQVWERGLNLQRIGLSTLYREVERFQLGPLSWERGPVLTIVQAVLISFCQSRDEMKRKHQPRCLHSSSALRCPWSERSMTQNGDDPEKTNSSPKSFTNISWIFVDDKTPIFFLNALLPP